MSLDDSKENKESIDPEDEGWDEIDSGDVSAAVTKPVDGVDQGHVYAGKQVAPPWMMGMYTAVVGLLMGVLLLVLPEFRQFNLTGSTSFETGYFLMIIPAIAIVWAFGGLIHKEYAGDRGKALSAIVIALAAGGILAYAIATDPSNEIEANGLLEEQQRLDMTEEELQEWREQKLDR